MFKLSTSHPAGFAISTVILMFICYGYFNRGKQPDSSGNQSIKLSMGEANLQQSAIHQCAHCASCSHTGRSQSEAEIVGYLWEVNKRDSEVASMRIISGMPLLSNKSNYQPGSRQSMVLENGMGVEMDVVGRHVHKDGTVVLAAELIARLGRSRDIAGRMHLQWNEKEEFFQGQIEYPGHPIAYQIIREESGDTVIHRRMIDELVCADVRSGQVVYGLPSLDDNARFNKPETEASSATPNGDAVQLGPELVPILNSYPSAEAVVYLDFDGQQVNGTFWGSRIQAEATGYPAAKITDIWRRVAVDMEPFNLNVTTDEAVYLNAPSRKRIRCIITPSSEWYGPNAVGGVAYLDSFRWTGDTPCWVFSNNLANGNKFIAEACSHEIGHTFGLRHDGKSGDTYYAGHGSGAVGWAPIMGSGYFKELTQWSKGEYSNATNTQDDLAIITGASNGFGYRSDDHGDQEQVATFLPRDNSDQVSGEGVIEQRGDEDVFEFVSGPGLLSLQVSPRGASSNLDLEIELYDVEGAVFAVMNPDTTLDASLQATVEGGTYFLRVSATGYGTADTGSSDYASLGAYKVSGQMAAEVVPTPYELTVDGLDLNDRGLEADPDGDGLNNLAEYVLGTDPAVASSVGSFTRIDANGAMGADFLIDLPVNIPADVIYSVEATNDLRSGNWTRIASLDETGIWTGEASVIEETGLDGKRRFRISESSDKNWKQRFWRLSFELAPVQ